MNSLAIGQDIRLNRTVTRIKWGGNQVQVGSPGRRAAPLRRAATSQAASR